ncbi:hypothetical protein BLOT_013267 [Blomia tropicalis]|nr:hypothetical protein BLOT_013267 [Blomia tropicalis]
MSNQHALMQATHHPFAPHHQTNNLANLGLNNGIIQLIPQHEPTIWPNVATEIDYGLLVNNDESTISQQSQQQHQQSQLKLNSMSESNDMSQATQIVLLPSPNLNLVANVPKQPESLQQQQQQQAQPQQPVQMIVQNDGGYQLLTSIPNVNVLVPTNLLLTNGYILIPNSPVTCPGQIETVTSDTQPNETDQTNNPLFLKQWVDGTNGVTTQPQMLQFESISAEQPMTLEPECEYIALTDSGTQTAVLNTLPESNGQINQTAHLISSNGQIVGIIGSDQIGQILQTDSSMDNPVLLTACIDPNDNTLNQLISGAATQVDGVTNSYDINTILASTISSITGVEQTKSDQNQAKQWLKDSYIVNRALKALKKNAKQQSATAHHHPTNRPHLQSVRR